MFSSAVSVGSRLNDWNTKPMCRRRSLVELLVGHVGDVVAADLHAAVGRAVEAGEQVHERRLAGARRAHDGGELAGGDLEGDAAQGVDGGLALAVATGDARRCDSGRRWPRRAAVAVVVSMGSFRGGQAGHAASAARRETACVSAPAESRAAVASAISRPVMPAAGGRRSRRGPRSRRGGRQVVGDVEPDGAVRGEREPLRLGLVDLDVEADAAAGQAAGDAGAGCR